MAFLSKVFLCAIACSLTLSACGHKGKLKTPAEIEKSEEKKKAKE